MWGPMGSGLDNKTTGQHYKNKTNHNWVSMVFSYRGDVVRHGPFDILGVLGFRSGPEFCLGQYWSKVIFLPALRAGLFFS